MAGVEVAKRSFPQADYMRCNISSNPVVKWLEEEAFAILPSAILTLANPTPLSSLHALEAQ